MANQIVIAVNESSNNKNGNMIMMVMISSEQMTPIRVFFSALFVRCFSVSCCTATRQNMTIKISNMNAMQNYIDTREYSHGMKIITRIYMQKLQSIQWKFCVAVGF